jgi:hypothetical protein
VTKTGLNGEGDARPENQENQGTAAEPSNGRAEKQEEHERISSEEDEEEEGMVMIKKEKENEQAGGAAVASPPAHQESEHIELINKVIFY